MDDLVTVSGLHVALGGRDVLRGIDLAIPRGRITVLAGPNGSGKSTLVRAIRRLVSPRAGLVTLEARDVARLSEVELARRIALLVQSPVAPEDLTVFGLVRLGRYPHQSFLRQWSRADEAAVRAAMVATAVDDLADRRLETLSGGQRQRAWIAMVLAQDAPTICLDEPINHLDVAHQLDCLDLLQRLNREGGKTIVVVLHDLNLAARHADRLVLMKQGRVFAVGTPGDLMTEERMREAFGISCRIIPDPVHGCPLCVPIASLARSPSPVPVGDPSSPRHAPS